MSNYLAIATVTASLSQLLQEAAREAVPGASVITERPDKTGNGTPGPTINLYLYQVIPNTAWRNADLPTRQDNGRLIQRPQTALDLHYLLTFYGSETQLEPQRLLGSAVRMLHDWPVLSRERIRATIQAATDADANHFLAGSDLVEQVETIKFSPLPLSLEELSKLWSVFFQTPYALSVSYQGSVVLIEGAGAPQRALPVRRRAFYEVPFRQPVIEQVMAQEGADAPIVAGSTLIIRGKQLRGAVTQVRIGEVEVMPQEAQEDQIRLQLPDEAWRAGAQGVQVMHPMMIGMPPVPHRSVESNVAAFVVHPVITEVEVSNAENDEESLLSADVTVHVNPTVGKAQRVVLLLNERASGEAAAYTFAAPPRKTDTDAITIPIHGVKTGAYLVRVQMDGAESLLDVDADPDSPTAGQYVGPEVTIEHVPSLRVTTLRLRRRRDVVSGLVTVKDEDDTSLEGATVSATWTLPGGTIQNQIADTGGNGVAGFATARQSGTYILTVTNITRAGYRFDPDNSVLSKSTTVP